MKFNVAALEDALGENDKRLIQFRENISEMEKLISDFLNYASFEEGRRNIQFEPGELAPMIERIAKNLGIDAMMEIIDDDSDQEVWCEWYLMEHCVRMILENAKRYAETKIRVELCRFDRAYELSVEDDGPGVPQEERESIFNAFVKSSETAPHDVGFGLGLALVYRMMSWHSGTVRCSASALGGAKFTIRWEKPKAQKPT
jgi:signal transduction histidine kinase